MQISLPPEGSQVRELQKSTMPRAVYIFLLVLAAWIPLTSVATSCNFPCDQSSCGQPRACPQGYAMEPCGCCTLCAKLEGEECGGFGNRFGSCGIGLYCNKTSDSLQSTGNCTRLCEYPCNHNFLITTINMSYKRHLSPAGCMYHHGNTVSYLNIGTNVTEGCTVWYVAAQILSPSQYTAIYPATLPSTPLHCHLPLYTATYPTTLPPTLLHCHLPRYTATYPSTLPSTPLHCHLPHYTATYPAILPPTPLYCHLPHYTATYPAILPPTPLHCHLPYYTPASHLILIITKPIYPSLLPNSACVKDMDLRCWQKAEKCRSPDLRPNALPTLARPTSSVAPNSYPEFEKPKNPFDYTN